MTGTSDTTDNTLTWTFTEPSRRGLFLQILNDHQDRAISFVGRITPSSTIEGPPRGTRIPSMGPVADTPDVALDPQPDGSFVGILEPRQVVWFRAYYGAAGYTSTISAAFTPSTGNANLDVYSGPDVGHLTQQLDAPSLTQTGLARQVSLPTQQWFYFTLSNSSATVPLGTSVSSRRSSSHHKWWRQRRLQFHPRPRRFPHHGRCQLSVTISATLPRPAFASTMM